LFHHALARHLSTTLLQADKPRDSTTYELKYDDVLFRF